MTNCEIIAKKRAWCRANGVCIMCRKNAAKRGCVTCQPCLDAVTAKKLRYQNRYRCPCSRPALLGKTKCETCTDRDRERARTDRVALKARQICTRCRRNQTKAGFVSCETCLAYVATKAREYYAARRAV